MVWTDRLDMQFDTLFLLFQQKINEKCYLKCVPKPGARLESGEQACLSKCMDRYMEAWNVVSRAYVARLQRESQGGNF